MAIQFPSNPSDNQIFTANGLQYTFNSTYGVWRAASTPSDGGGGGVTTYEFISNLPATGTTGDLAYVTDNQRMYLWNGSVWFHILTAETPNTAPFITQQPKFGYSLATDGTPLVLTLNGIDPEGTAITWDYTVTSGSIGNTATISINNNQFTITPSTNTADAGEFTLTFTASDGLHVANSNPTYFSLYFSYDWIYGTMTVEDSIANPAFSTIVSGANTTTLRFGNCLKFMRPNELLVSSPGTSNSSLGAIWIYDTSNVPATCIAHYARTGPANFGMAADFNDEWIIVSTDESSTSGNAQVLWFKRNADGTWPVDANGRLTPYQETSTGALGANQLNTVSMDKNNNRCLIANGIDDNVFIYEYNDVTMQWENKITDTIPGGSNASSVQSSMLDNYALIVGGDITPLYLYKRSPEGIWSRVNQYYLYSKRARAHLLVYNGDHYIILVGASNGSASGAVTNNNSYNVQILKIDELSNNISEIINESQTLTTQAASATEMAASTGNLTNYDLSDAYISGSVIHVIVGRAYLASPDVKYFQVDLGNGNVVQKNISKTGLTITGAGGANRIHTVAFDRYTGKLAVAQTTFNTGAADAGKVWILR